MLEILSTIAATAVIYAFFNWVGKSMEPTPGQKLAYAKRGLGK